MIQELRDFGCALSMTLSSNSASSDKLHPADASTAPFSNTVRLTRALAWRDIQARYRGSALGVVWSMLTPLMMLGVYTFVFGMVFRSRWSASNADAPPVEFAVILFVGLIIFQIFADVINRAPTLILSHSNYVKKVIFPLEILVPVSLASALFHAGVSFLILIPFLLLVFHTLNWTIIFLPLILTPFLLLILGVSWVLASIGSYARDIGQFVGTVTTAMLFLAPIFFPVSALPVWLQPWLRLNPITLPVEQARNAIIFGQIPDFKALAVYFCWSLVISALGFLWFQRTRKGFADVL
jgi:lipopolysaccharide transport system permease protein